MDAPDWADTNLNISHGFLTTSARNMEASVYALFVHAHFLKQWDKTRHDLKSHQARIEVITAQVTEIAGRAEIGIANDADALALELLHSEQEVLFSLMDELLETLAVYDPAKRAKYESATNANRVVVARAEVDSYLHDVLILASMRDGKGAAFARKSARASLSQGIGHVLKTLNERGVPAQLTRAESTRFRKANRLRNRIVHGGGRLEARADGSVTHVEESRPDIDGRHLSECEATFMMLVKAVNKAFMSVLELDDSQRELLELLDEHLSEHIAMLST